MNVETDDVYPIKDDANSHWSDYIANDGRFNYRSKLTINGSHHVYFVEEMPNWFHRIFQRIFFGFKWTEIKVKNV